MKTKEKLSKKVEKMEDFNMKKDCLFFCVWIFLFFYLLSLYYHLLYFSLTFFYLFFFCIFFFTSIFQFVYSFSSLVFPTIVLYFFLLSFILSTTCPFIYNNNNTKNICIIYRFHLLDQIEIL